MLIKEGPYITTIKPFFLRFRVIVIQLPFVIQFHLLLYILHQFIKVPILFKIRISSFGFCSNVSVRLKGICYEIPLPTILQVHHPYHIGRQLNQMNFLFETAA